MFKTCVSCLTLSLLAAVGGAFPTTSERRLTESHLSRPQRLQPNLENWFDAVHEHQPGEPDQSLAVVARWSHLQIEGLVWQLKDRLRIHAFPGMDAYGVHDRPSAIRFVKRAALLHTDIALLTRAADKYVLPTASQRGTALDDGQHLGTGSWTFHWDIARQILDAVRSDPRSAADVRDWYVVTAAWLQERFDYAELLPHLTYGREIFPKDPVIALYLGSVHESLAEPRIQLSIDRSETTAGSGQLHRGGDWESVGAIARGYAIDTADGERIRAERLLRAALRLDPSLAEARVRLGRVLGLRNRHADALDELQQVASSPSASLRLRFLAHLFSGQSLQSTGRRSDAIRAFTAAAELYPDVQSSRLARSQAIRDAGHLTKSVEILTTLQGPNSSGFQDPWHVYHYTHEPDAKALLVQFRQSWLR